MFLPVNRSPLPALFVSREVCLETHVLLLLLLLGGLHNTAAAAAAAWWPAQHSCCCGHNSRCSPGHPPATLEPPLVQAVMLLPCYSSCRRPHVPHHYLLMLFRAVYLESGCLCCHSSAAAETSCCVSCDSSCCGPPSLVMSLLYRTWALPADSCFLPC